MVFSFAAPAEFGVILVGQRRLYSLFYVCLKWFIDLFHILFFQPQKCSIFTYNKKEVSAPRRNTLQPDRSQRQFSKNARNIEKNGTNAEWAQIIRTGRNRLSFCVYSPYSGFVFMRVRPKSGAVRFFLRFINRFAWPIYSILELCSGLPLLLRASFLLLHETNMARFVIIFLCSFFWLVF